MQISGCEFRPELYYDNEFQIWVRRERDQSLTVGMTDISQTIAGKILHARVRKPGTRRPPGKPVATIESGKWAGPIPNYFDCIIIEGNPVVLENPGLLNLRPFEAWVARVTPIDGPEKALAAFLTGDAAARGYAERCEKDNIQCKRGVDSGQ